MLTVQVLMCSYVLICIHTKISITKRSCSCFHLMYGIHVVKAVCPAGHVMYNFSLSTMFGIYVYVGTHSAASLGMSLRSTTKPYNLEDPSGFTYNRVIGYNFT